jgi:hypothetical protein
MALRFLQTEMHGDTSRWGRRAVVKHEARRLRRRNDRRTAVDGLCEATAGSHTKPHAK